MIVDLEKIKNFDNILKDKLKLALYKKFPLFYDYVDFYNDSVFSEPILFTYLLSPNNNIDIKFLYIKYSSTNSFKITINKADKNFAYFPGAGRLNISDQLEYLMISDGECFINGDPEKKIELNDEKFLNNGTRIYDYIHSDWTTFFNHDEKITIGNNNWRSSDIDVLNRSYAIIEKYNPSFYKLLIHQVKNVVLFEGESNCFATILAHHTIFLNSTDPLDIIYTLDHILHEGSHVIFNTYTINSKNDLFVMNYKSLLSDFTGDKDDTGILYDRFHGLYTQYNINSNMSLYIDNNTFQGTDHLHLLARFCSNMLKFGLALEAFNIRENYQIFGWELYCKFRERHQKLFNVYKEIIEEFNFSQQSYVFNFDTFLSDNINNPKVRALYGK